MELRQTEEKVNELFGLYEKLRKTVPLGNDPTSRKIALLPELEPPSSEQETKQQQQQQNQPTEQQPVEVILLSHLQTLRTSVDELVPKMSKFRKRLHETDPVTGNPRYGKKTEERVTILLERYGKLADAIETTDLSIEELQSTVNQLEEEKQRAQKEEERLKEKAREALNREEEEEQRKVQQQQAEQEAARQRELQELNQRAEESRRARQAQLEEEQRARQERERQDREWMATIQVGPVGVQDQLGRLREATDATEHMDALTALHTLFSQIVSHPEETKFRRVRRDHPKFNQDIGRHVGGKEVLIAAGFRLGAIDEVPSFISTEPNIEKDMDGWSDWFNLLKKTLEIVEEEMLK